MMQKLITREALQKTKHKKIGSIITLILLIALLFPIKIFAAENNTAIIHSESGDYVVYVKDIKEKFKFAITNMQNADKMQLKYVTSSKDEQGENVIFISKEKYESLTQKGENTKSYIYVKDMNGEDKIEGQEIDFANAVEQSQLQETETLTKRIATKTAKNLKTIEKEEDGVKVTTTLGGLKITEKDGKYEYSLNKVEEGEYKELENIANNINTNADKMDTVEKIKTYKSFYNLYNNLLKIQNWREVQDSQIIQPEDSNKGDTYVIFLSKIAEDGTQTQDVKFLTTNVTEKEGETIETSVEPITVKEAKKLPITGESLALFIVLAVISIVATIVYFRVKKLKNENTKN